jgi:hypothetical protein
MKQLIRYIINRLSPQVTKPISLAAEFVFAEAVDGDYLEFGVFKGASFIEAVHKLEAAHRKWGDHNVHQNRQAYSEGYSSDADRDFHTLQFKKPVRYIAFDSFEGLPSLEQVDQGHSRFRQSRYNFAEKDFIRNVLLQTKLPRTRLITVPGFYQDTLNDELSAALDLKSASVIMIDCDLYSSTRDVLKYITTLIVDGTILIFDDWYAYKGSPLRGQRLATSEWLKKNQQFKLSEFASSGYNQRAFIVNIV